MKNDDTRQSQNTYFRCLDIYESTIAFNAKEEVGKTVHSGFVHKVGTLLLHRYKIIKVLAQNEFGFVYLVDRINKNKKFIIKEFFPHQYVTRNDKGDMIINTPMDIDKLIRFNHMQKFFMGEVHNLEKIATQAHPNILKIAAIERNQNNTTYIISPFEEGMTLQEYMDNNEAEGKKQFDSKEIYQILDPLLAAIEHLHTLNICHLNIKPENIFLQKNGDLLLTGFESSVTFDDEDSNVHCNAYTPAYAAPEQLDVEQFSEIGKTSDIYAIGVLLYKMVTGFYPIEADKRISCKEKYIEYDPYVFLREKKELLLKYDSLLLSTIDKTMVFSSKDRFQNIATVQQFLYKKPKKRSASVGNGKWNLFLYLLLGIALISMIIWGFNKIGTGSKSIDNIQENRLNNKNDVLLERENTARLEEKKAEEDKLNQARLEKEKTEQNRLEQEKAEEEKRNRERLEKEKVEQKRLEEEKLEQIKLDLYNEKINNIKRQSNERDLLLAEDIKARNKRIDENRIDNILENTSVLDMIVDNTSQDKNNTTLLEMGAEIEALSTQVKVKKVLNKKKNIKKRFKKRKKKVLRKKRTKKKTAIQRKKSSVKNNSGLVWFCKAQAGIIRTSAKHGNRKQSQNIAIRQCNRKSRKQKKCRIVNCFLTR